MPTLSLLAPLSQHLLLLGGGVTLAILLLALLLHALNLLGGLGKSIQTILWRAPALDVVVLAYTALPWVAAVLMWMVRPAAGGDSFADRLMHPFASFMAYLVVSVIAQMLALTLWCWGHELVHARHRKGPRIVGTLNRKVGRFRNHLAVWWTAWAVPVFTLIRIAEYLVYPPLTWLIRLPRYNAAEWVNVSRQKFTGLVGWDLIWCLYCDWMTGIWSLGSEMLRNVESFWCPIRFSSPEKCANCSIDFPDVKGSWAPASGTMSDVTGVLDAHYPGPNGDNSWHGHPARLTVNGKPLSQKPVN